MKKNGFPDLSKYEIYQKMESDEFITLVFKRIHKDFLLDITGEMETVPELGDLTIFWDKGKEWKAYVALLISKEYAAQYQEYPYKSSTQEWHGCAIRFRNPEQLSKIIKYKPNVIQKEETGKN